MPSINRNTSNTALDEPELSATVLYPQQREDREAEITVSVSVTGEVDQNRSPPT